MRVDKTPPEEDSEPESEGQFYSLIARKLLAFNGFKTFQIKT